MPIKRYGEGPNPCTQNCTRRTAHCHSECQDYAGWAADRAARKAAYEEQRAHARRLSDYGRETSDKICKRVGIK